LPELEEEGHGGPLAAGGSSWLFGMINSNGHRVGLERRRTMSCCARAEPSRSSVTPSERTSAGAHNAALCDDRDGRGALASRTAHQMKVSTSPASRSRARHVFLFDSGSATNADHGSAAVK